MLDMSLSSDISRELDPVFVSPLLRPCRIINISCVCSHRPYCGHNKPRWTPKRQDGTFRRHVSRGDESFSEKEARLLLGWDNRGGGGEATAPQVVPKTKGFPWLKTQLQSLFLALISQVWWKFAAEAFIPQCMWGEKAIERVWGGEKASESGSEEEC